MREIKNAVALFVLIVVMLAMFAIAANAQTTNEAVCKLYRTGTQRHSGSGTFVGVSDDLRLGLVISCYHVCGGKESMDCYFKNAPGLASQPFNGRVVKLDSRYDLAAMVIPNPGFPPAAIGDFQKHDGLYAAAGFGGGKYSAAIGPVYRSDSVTLWTRTGIWPGHSGGGLFDPFGRWCGVTNWNNGSNGPNPNGFTKSRSGVALQKFVTEAAYECGPFRKLLGRGGGGGGSSDCPDGNCPNPGVPGAGYGLAPNYQPLTPLASQPQQQTVTPPAVVTPPPVAQAVPLAVAVPPTTQPAPVPDAPKAESSTDNPFAALAQQLDAVYRNEREQAAAAAAMAAYRAAMSGEAPAPAVQRLPKQVEAEAKEPSSLVSDLPVVTMQVEYREKDGRVRVESAKIDFATYVRQTFGLANEETK